MSLQYDRLRFTGVTGGPLRITGATLVNGAYELATAGGADYELQTERQTTMDNILFIPGLTSRVFDRVSGLVSAYSLRRVRSAYSGACVRVRRSSDSTEQDFGFAGNVVNTDAILSFCGAGDGFVTAWYDQGLAGLHVSQATLLRQPRIVNSGALEVNGSRPTVRFLGSQLLSSGAPNILFGSAISVNAVASSGSGEQAIIAQWNAVSPRVFGLFDLSAVAGVRFTLNNNTIQTLTGSRTQPMPLSTLFGVYNSVNSRAWRNGVQGTATTATAAITAGGTEPITLGAERAGSPTSFLNGSISESFFSSNVLADSLRQQIDANQQNFWGIV
jgi:hypothetical protein